MRQIDVIRLLEGSICGGELGKEFVKLSGAIGIEVQGVNLSMPIKEETAVALKSAWAKNSILLIRNQKLDDEAQYAFARIFGEIALSSKSPVEKRDYVPNSENPMHLISDEVDEDSRRYGSLGHGEMYFHTEKCYEEESTSRVDNMCDGDSKFWWPHKIC